MPRKVHLGELADALGEIAAWTQAIQAELLTHWVTGGMPATLDDLVQTVGAAVDSTAAAAAQAKVADAVLTTYPGGGAAPKKHDLATAVGDATINVKTFVDTATTGTYLAPTAVSGAILGRGC